MKTFSLKFKESDHWTYASTEETEEDSNFMLINYEITFKKVINFY